MSASIFAQQDSVIFKVELFLLKNQYDSALNATDKFLEVDSLNWRIHYYRGKALQSKFNYFEAIESFEKANMIDSANQVIENALAYNYDFIGKDEEAISIYYNQYLRDTIALEPMVNLANIFRKKREYGSAIFYYQKAIELDLENFYYYKQLAYCYDKINIPDGAIAYYNVALQMNPYDLSMYVQLANILNSSRNFKSALQVCEQGLSYFKDEPQLLKLRAYAHYLNKDFDSSIVSFNQLLEKGDTSFFNLKYRGLSLFEKKEFESAIKDLSKANEINKKDAELTFYLGSALGRADKALEGLLYLHRSKSLLSPMPDELSNIYSEMAFIYQQQEKYQKSLDYLKLAYKAKADPILSFKMAQLYDYFLDQKKLAVDYYDGYLTMTNLPDTLISDSSYVIENSFTRNEKIKEHAVDRIRVIKEELFFEDGNKK